MSLARDRRLLGQIEAVLSPARPTLLHVNLDHFPDNTGRLALCAGHRAGCRAVIGTLHCLPQRPVFPRLVQHHYDRMSMRAAERIVAPAGEVRERLVAWYGARDDYVTEIPNGASADCFTIREARVTRGDVGIAQDDSLIVQVGSVNENRGQLVLLQALESLWRDYARLKVLFVGRVDEDTYLTRCHEAASRAPAGRIHWLGYRTDATEILRLADVAVVASHQEVHPFALLEAMATRKAIVATAVGGIPEILDHGRCGLIVPPGDAHAMGVAIRSLLDSPALGDGLRMLARRRAENLYTEERMAKRTFELYRQLMSAAA